MLFLCKKKKKIKKFRRRHIKTGRSTDCLKIVWRLSPVWSRRYPHTHSHFIYTHTGGAFRAVERQAHAVCDYVIRPNATAGGGGSGETMMNRWSGFFSTSNTAWRVWPAPCSFTFPVQPGQSVQINLLTFNITYVQTRDSTYKPLPHSSISPKAPRPKQLRVGQ